MNLGFLILTEYYDGYKFKWFLSSLEVLDTYEAELQWNRVTNLGMLKIVSYVIDYHWAILKTPIETKEKHMKFCEECTEKNDCLSYRMKSHAQHYSFSAFAAYFFYPPLYLAGPTTSYNAWISQVQVPQRTLDSKKISIYLLRFVITYLCLEWFIHNLYFPAIAANSDNKWIWEKFNAWQLITASYFILKWI